MNKRSSWMWMIIIPVLLLSGCGQSRAPASPASPASLAKAGSLPRGVMSAAQACRLVVGKAGTGFLAGPEQVHLVLTSYAKGEPVESQGDVSLGMPAQTLVWVVEVHAKAIHWNHSVPAGYKPPAQPDTDYSAVLNARTGSVSDQGECACWPLPLSRAGTVVSLPPKC
jgi:hypothetical protein